MTKYLLLLRKQCGTLYNYIELLTLDYVVP
jgi:hypothetical protein